MSEHVNDSSKRTDIPPALKADIAAWEQDLADHPNVDGDPDQPTPPGQQASLTYEVNDTHVAAARARLEQVAPSPAPAAPADQPNLLYEPPPSQPGTQPPGPDPRLLYEPGSQDDPPRYQEWNYDPNNGSVKEQLEARLRQVDNRFDKQILYQLTNQFALDVDESNSEFADRQHAWQQIGRRFEATQLAAACMLNPELERQLGYAAGSLPTAEMTAEGRTSKMVNTLAYGMVWDLRRIRLEQRHGDPRKPSKVNDYIGQARTRMNEIETAMEHGADGLRAATKRPSSIVSSILRGLQLRP